MRISIALTLFAGLFLIAGCGETTDDATNAGTPASDGDTAVTAASNELCPIMGEAISTDGGTAEFNGKTIGFCCPECVEKWESLSDADKEAKLAESMKADTSGADAGETTESAVVMVNTMCPIMGKPVKDGGGITEFNGKTVGFCCPGCIDKFDALTDEEKTAKLAAAAK